MNDLKNVIRESRANCVDLDNTLTVHVPKCVKKMIIVKIDGKKMVIDV